MLAVNTPADIYYFVPSSGNANVLSNWNRVPDGSGGAPSSLTASNCFYIINGNKTANITGTFGAAGVYIGVGDETGGSLDITGTPGTLTIANTCTSLQASINVNTSSTLNMAMAPGATKVPILQYLSPASTVVYNGSVAQNGLSANYGNLTINNSAGITLIGDIGVSGLLSSTAGTINTTTNSAKITFNGIAAQTIPGNSVYTGGNAYDITINNGSGVTLANGNTLTILDSLIVNSGEFKLGAGSNAMMKGVSYVPSSPLTLDSTYKAGYSLVWHDEFDGASGAAANPTIWTLAPYGSSSYTVGSTTYNTPFAAANSYLDGQGHLTIRVDKAGTSSPYTFTGGGIASGSSYAFMKQYGYFEARIKFPSNQGVVSSFWMQSPIMGANAAANNPAAYGTEMDIVEFIGPGTTGNIFGQVNSTIHKNGYSAPYHQANSNQNTVGKLANQSAWHKIAMEWAPDYCDFYTDDVLIWHMADPGFISKHPEYLWLSAQIGWGQTPTGTYPSYTLYDYVRVYNKN